jgi:hypothetical protein
MNAVRGLTPMARAAVTADEAADPRPVGLHDALGGDDRAVLIGSTGAPRRPTVRLRLRRIGGGASSHPPCLR